MSHHFVEDTYFRPVGMVFGRLFSGWRGHKGCRCSGGYFCPGEPVPCHLFRMVCFRSPTLVALQGTVGILQEGTWFLCEAHLCKGSAFIPFSEEEMTVWEIMSR